MKQTDVSQLFSTPFGAQADSTTITTIPQSKPATGRASMLLGFSKDNGTPIAAGGTPPFLEDMNGILNMLASSARAAELGLLHPFSASYASAIGGYPLGSTVAHPTIAGRFLVCTQDNNTAAPPGNGWIDPLSDFVTNEAMAASLQQEVQRAEAAEAGLQVAINNEQNRATSAENGKLSRYGDISTGILTFDSGNSYQSWAASPQTVYRIGGGIMSTWSQVDGAGNIQLLIGGNNPGQNYSNPWIFNPANQNILTPGGGVLPEVLGLSGRVVIQNFIATTPWEAQGTINFPNAFKPGTSPFVICAPVTEMGTNISSISDVRQDNNGNLQITNTGFDYYRTAGQSDSNASRSIPVLAIGIM